MTEDCQSRYVQSPIQPAIRKGGTEGDKATNLHCTGAFKTKISTQFED